MTALAAIAAEIRPQLFGCLDLILATAAQGSVITRDNAVKILVTLSAEKSYSTTTLPLLAEQLRHAPANQLPAYAEQALPVVRNEYREDFSRALQQRLDDFAQGPKRKRIEKVLRKLS